MTHHTDAERALFEAVASDDGKWPQAIERDAKGNYLLLTTANGWMWWQAARRAPAAPVPQGWKLKGYEDGSITVQAPSGERWRYQETTGTGTGSEFIYSLLKAMLAAAPQPPEVAPVKLPGYGIDTANHAGIRVCGYTEQQVRQLLADQQFKLDELAMLTRMVVHAFRQVAPDNKTAAKAVDYLKRKGLAGNPLRAAQEQST